MEEESLEDRIKAADEEINAGLKNLAKMYKIDLFEVQTNYLKNYTNILRNPPEDIDALGIVYSAYKETIAQYESVFKKK